MWRGIAEACRMVEGVEGVEAKEPSPTRPILRLNSKYLIQSSFMAVGSCKRYSNIPAVSTRHELIDGGRTITIDMQAQPSHRTGMVDVYVLNCASIGQSPTHYMYSLPHIHHPDAKHQPTNPIFCLPKPLPARYSCTISASKPQAGQAH